MFFGAPLYEYADVRYSYARRCARVPKLPGTLSPGPLAAPVISQPRICTGVAHHARCVESLPRLASVPILAHGPQPRTNSLHTHSLWTEPGAPHRARPLPIRTHVRPSRAMPVAICEAFHGWMAFCGLRRRMTRNKYGQASDCWQHVRRSRCECRYPSGPMSSYQSSTVLVRPRGPCTSRALLCLPHVPHVPS